MLFVVINPQAGKKLAQEIFKTTVLPNLRVEFEAHETTAPLEAAELTIAHFSKHPTTKDILILGGKLISSNPRRWIDP